VFRVVLCVAVGYAAVGGGRDEYAVLGASSGDAIGDRDVGGGEDRYSLVVAVPKREVADMDIGPLVDGEPAGGTARVDDRPELALAAQNERVFDPDTLAVRAVPEVESVAYGCSIDGRLFRLAENAENVR